MCPRTAAAKQAISAQGTPGAMYRAMSTGTAPLRKSQKKQKTLAFLPTHRVTLVAPVLQEPSLRMSMP